MNKKFELFKTSEISNARYGIVRTMHGNVPTPFFMPIATRGTVKTLTSEDVEQLGSPIVLSNTYHLYLRTGLDVLRAYGGLHNFMSWNGALLTDSGGYQVFSLSKMRKITDEGALFSSHIDGSKHMLTPELSMEIQQVIGSDIAMVLDECTPAGSSYAYLQHSLERTLYWAKRCSDVRVSTQQVFSIVQGGIDTSMRIDHAKALMEIGFDGYAIGGLSVGEKFEDACEVISALDPILPKDKPRYFMGGAQPHEIVEYVKRGIDMFDCVLPTRNARHGLLYRFVHDDVSKKDFYETVHITNEKYKISTEILNDGSSRYTMGYIRHLFSVEEMTGQRLVTVANLKFYLRLMELIRIAIDEGKL